MTRKVIVTIEEDGNARMETQGFKGKACVATMEKILADASKMGLATKTDKITYTSEYRAQEAVQTRASR